MFRLRRQSVYHLLPACFRRLDRALFTGALISVTTFTIVGAGLNLTGCSKSFAQYGSLYDAGILPLSTDNPYLAANAFLAQEIERSSFLGAFVNEKGAPHAIQVKRGGKSLSLYYPKSKQTYLASKVSSGATTRQWLISGPYNMSRPDFLEIRRLRLNLRAEPSLFFASTENENSINDIHRNGDKIQPQIVVVQPTPTPTPKKKRRVVKSPGIVKGDAQAVGGSGEVIKAPPTPNADQKAIELSKKFAPRAINGDLIHQVNFDGESLESISSWYTGAIGNLGAISSANKLEPGHKLKRGESILIPVNLVTTLVRKDK